MTMKLRGR